MHSTVEGATRRIQRIDGWTPQRIRIFLTALARGASVTRAAGAAGMSRQGAYAFRDCANGRGFAAAWLAAQEVARRRQCDLVMAEIRARQLRRLGRLTPPLRHVELARAGGGQGAPHQGPDAWQV